MFENVQVQSWKGRGKITVVETQLVPILPSLESPPESLRWTAIQKVETCQLFSLREGSVPLFFFLEGICKMRGTDFCGVEHRKKDISDCNMLAVSVE
jgi:hypothetical protein